ncbi:hypothetical protein PF010_g11340 [Phytophthora fragariae]|uniref:Integrase catalytic domain-containing protein n=1 Tax=Phytophthora fragariae TaxID=53985 RepID=A0A6G0L6W9_9STRA|nr:hypothetical protein PF010_g11340 [Phytophthora fragariae]
MRQVIRCVPGCCMGKMREDNFSRNPEKTVKSAGVLDLIHSDVMGPMQTETPGGSTYAVTFIDDFSRHIMVYFMKMKTEVLEKFKMFRADIENATGRKIKCIRSGNGGKYKGRLFKEYLAKQGIRHEKTVPYTPQQNGLAEHMNRSLVQTATTRASTKSGRLKQSTRQWKKAIASELESLIANKSWKLVPKPTHQRPIGCRWVLALKRDDKGQVVRYKARLVAKVYSQHHGIDFEETHSPVAFMNSVRAMLARCGVEGMEIEQCDVDTAFLYGTLEEGVSGRTQGTPGIGRS